MRSSHLIKRHCVLPDQMAEPENEVAELVQLEVHVRPLMDSFKLIVLNGLRWRG